MKKIYLLLTFFSLSIFSFSQDNYRNWEDVYSNQNHNNFINPADILAEFGVMNWNSNHNRNEAVLNLNRSVFQSSSGQTLFLEGFDGRSYTYLHDIIFFDGYYSDISSSLDPSKKFNKSLVILYTISYDKYGSVTYGSKYDREEVHFAFIEKNSQGFWDVKKINTMDIHTSDDGSWNIGDIEYIDIDLSNIQLLEDNKMPSYEQILIDLNLNKKWILHVSSSGGHMGEYWDNSYCYVLKDLDCKMLYSDYLMINWYYDQGDGWDVESQRTYRNDILIEEICWDRQGNLVDCE